MPFSIRKIDEIKQDIIAAAEYYKHYPFQTCFLQDGDSFIMKTAQLIEILGFLKQHFPSLERISSYGRAQTMIRKAPQEIKDICDAGLNVLYCGWNPARCVLKKINKGSTSSDMIKSAHIANRPG
jgi:hypothetical protein